MKLQKDSRTVLCDLDQYKTIQFNYNSPASREFIYDISDFTKYNKRGALTLHFDVKSSSFVLTDIYSGQIKIALGDYGRIIITCAASEAKRTLYRRIDLESLYNFHLYTSEGNTPKGKNFRSYDGKSKFPAKSFFSKSKRLPAVEKLPTVAELQKDPLVLKKSKYRYQTKAFGVKRSDFARSKGLRASKYTSVSTTRSHMSLSFSYDIKHKLLNFLLGKFNMTVSDLQTFFASNRMTSGNEMQSFAYGMLTRLPHILVSSGFCTNYSNANKMIKSGFVKLNGVTVTDVNYTVNVGDVLNVVKGENTSKLRFMTIPSHLTVNGKFGTILVNSNLALSSSFTSDSLIRLNVGLKRNKVSGGLKDPLMTLLGRFAPFIRNIGR